MARKRNGSRASKQRGNLLWTAVLGTASDITAATSTFAIVADGDWQRGSGQSSATLLAIRGYMTIYSIGVLESDVKAYIQLVDEDAASEAPVSVGTYVSEDILWTGGFAKGDSSATGSNFHHEVFNVKAKRRMKNGQEVRLVIRASVASQFRVSLIMRGLLKLD